MLHARLLTRTFIYFTIFLVTYLAHLQAVCSNPYCYDCLKKRNDGTCHLFYGSEWLIWTVCQSDLNFAVDVDPFDEEAILGDGKVHFLDYDWTGGWRGWLGWNWAWGWELKLAYTYFQDEAKNKVDTDGHSIDLLASLFHPESSEEDAEFARGKLCLEYQTVDVIFEKVICFCDETVILQPFLGGRALRLTQSLKVLYQGEDFEEEAGEVKWDSDVKAAGLRSGLEMGYQWKYGLGLYGVFGGSLLASRSDNKHKQRFLDDPGEVTRIEIDLKEKQWTCLPCLDVAAGVNWTWRYFGCLLVKTKLGYEFNKLFHTQQIRRYHDGNAGVSSENTSGNIGLHGVTFSTEVYF